MAEEDAELKELVIQSLENNGVLAKIRAQLRASVFLALDEANTLEKKKPLANNELQNYLATRNGQIVACLVREFLQYFNLDSTLSVYESESFYGQFYSDEDRHSLCRDLGLDLNEISEGPIVDAVAAKQLVRSDASNFKENATKVDLSQMTLTTEESKFTKPNSLKVTPLPTTTYSREAEESERDPFFDGPDPNEVDARFGKSLEIGGFLGTRDSELQQDQRLSGELVESKSAGADEKQTRPITMGYQDSTFTISPFGSLKDASPLGSLRDAPPLALLRDAPPLTNAKGTSKLPPLWSDGKATTFKTASAQDDDYEEDFQSSASVRSDMKTGTEHSIEEDIEENFSGAVDDLLSNEGISEVDDVTTDHTVSNISAGMADYLESMS